MDEHKLANTKGTFVEATLSDQLLSSLKVPARGGRRTQCGIGPYRPQCLQRFATPLWMLFWLCWFSLMQGIILSGLVPSVMTSIERRYGLPSSALGTILQSSDIGHALSCIPIAYFGGRHSKPLYLGVSLFLMTCGTFLFSMPQSFSGWHVQQEKLEIVGFCQTTPPAPQPSTRLLPVTLLPGLELSNVSLPPSASHLTGASSCDSTSIDNDAVWKKLERYKFTVLFCFAQLLIGVGSTPLLSLGVSYIDENVKTTDSPFYLGIFYTCLIFGPAIGFTLTSIFSSLHVDFLSSGPYTTPNFDEKDPKWVGAWWAGFQIVSIFCLFAVFPILSLPRILPGAEKYQKNRIARQNGLRKMSTSSTESMSSVSYAPAKKMTKKLALGSPSTGALESSKLSPPIPRGLNVVGSKKGAFLRRFLSDLKHIPSALLRILSNASYVCITLSCAAEGMLIAGLIGFMAKYLEKQFNLSTSRTNLFIGSIMVPFAGIGVLSSGYVLKRFKFTCTRTIKYCVVMSVCTALLSPMFLAYCTPSKLVGIEVPYDRSSNETVSPDKPILQAMCNQHCSCNERSYHPVCAIAPDGSRSVYLSACFAGCPEPFHTAKKAYGNCTCPPENSTVNAGLCEVQCSSLAIFLVLFAPMVFCTFSIGVPAQNVVLRCVDYEERSFALGIQWILIRCLGMIPAPTIFAWLFDVSCIVGQKKMCDADAGFCSLYDNKMLANLFLAFALIGKTISCIFMALALIFFRRSGRPDEDLADCPEVVSPSPDGLQELATVKSSQSSLNLKCKNVKKVVV